MKKKLVRTYYDGADSVEMIVVPWFLARWNTSSITASAAVLSSPDVGESKNLDIITPWKEQEEEEEEKRKE